MELEVHEDRSVCSC